MGNGMLEYIKVSNKKRCAAIILGCICYIVMVYLFLKNLGSKGTFLSEYPILKELVYIVIPVIHVYIFLKNKKR